MIEEFFNDYTAGEFLNWLSKEYADEYIKENIIVSSFSQLVPKASRAI